jgi:hemerythrin-like domain-containing protein
MCDHCGCREYEPIAELTAEHETILDLAAALADATRHGGAVDESLPRRLLDLLERHGAKEEAGLYPLLIAEAGKPDDEYAELEREHREFATAIEKGRFTHLALYALQRHIEEEEEVLFSGALFHFDGDTWDVLEDIHHHVDEAVPVS